MDTIDNNVVQQVAEHVIRATRLADIHTVTIELNGQHGGADVMLKGNLREPVRGACILTDEPGENEDDCTTHDHEQGDDNFAMYVQVR